VKAPSRSDVARDTRRAIRLFKTRSLGFKIFAVVIAPLIYGLITGIALGSSAAAYWVLIAIGVIGAISSGYEHEEPLSAVWRGCLSGAFFTGGLLGILWISGWTPRVVLLAPSVFFPLNCIAGAVICSGVAWWRHRAEGDAAVQV